MDRQQRLNLAYQRSDKLHIGDPDYLKCLRRFTIEAVEEDIGRAGDITVSAVLKMPLTIYCIPSVILYIYI